MFTGIAKWFLEKQAKRLGIDSRCFFCNIYRWSGMVREIESDNNPKASADTTTAKGVYQFTNDSVHTAKNRMFNMGFLKEDIREIDGNPHFWTDEQADCVFLANMFAQRGSDKLLTKIGEDSLDAMKEAYYKFHHTAPDKATIDRVERIMV
jgi:hypothetical protein